PKAASLPAQSHARSGRASENGQSHSQSQGHLHGRGEVTADNARRVLLALVLTGGFMLVEVAGGLLTGSLALIADAGHMLTDTAALALAWMAFRVARRPNDARRTYGYHRFQVLAAFVNGVTLVAVVGWIVIEAVRRLFAPVEVLAGPMLAIAAIGLLVNLLALWILRRGDPGNLNLEGAAVHVLGDLLGSLAAIAAAAVILWTGWMPIDPLLSVLVALLVLRSAWYIVRRSAHILLEGAPDWLDVPALRRDLVAAVPEVEDIHHVHAWMLTDERPLMTLHATVRHGSDTHAALLAIQGFLEQHYGVGHATIQIEPACCPDVTTAR
ncbi:MAG: cation diffusion facilitator family transporter, partial [Kiloniellales bacterium]|nr:cation diffusion facilitator family transporter [Kiloniellales bacterium]